MKICNNPRCSSTHWGDRGPQGQIPVGENLGSTTSLAIGKMLSLSLNNSLTCKNGGLGGTGLILRMKQFNIKLVWGT